MAGLMDIALHPNFAQNHWVYISYHKPMGTAKTVDGTNRDYPIASNSILRGTWDGKGLTDIHDVFVADDIDMEASRITFGPDGMAWARRPKHRLEDQHGPACTNDLAEKFCG
jgi:glucose/arabinose dehydrogenase